MGIGTWLVSSNRDGLDGQVERNDDYNDVNETFKELRGIILTLTDSMYKLIRTNEGETS